MTCSVFDNNRVTSLPFLNDIFSFSINCGQILPDQEDGPTTTRDCNCDSNDHQGDNGEHVIRILILHRKLMVNFMGLKRTIKTFYEETGIQVELDWINSENLSSAELRAQLQAKLQLYDGFILPSLLLGTAAQFDGFMDLTEIVRTRPELKWLDIFLGFRENVAVYDNKILLFPLDGDANYMFYRKDVLEHFNQTVPRTWDEYWRVAKAVHMQEYNGTTMYGSCLGRMAGRHGAFWTLDVLSSYTQTKGKAEGCLFDPSNLLPLAGEAMAEAIKMLEMQVRYGHPLEFECGGGGDIESINILAMNKGECALTYNWGDSFTQGSTSDPPSQVVGLMRKLGSFISLYILFEGIHDSHEYYSHSYFHATVLPHNSDVAPLPGADKVLNRKTMSLEPCTKANCGGIGGHKFDDIGWINRAPFLANGGWAGAVNNNVDEQRKTRIVDFFIYLCSPEISINNLVQNASTPSFNGTGVDPFRASHFTSSKWVEAGYDKEAVESYEKAVVETTTNPNAAIDIRFPAAGMIYAALEEEVQKYLEATVSNDLPESEEDRHRLRLQTSDKISKRFSQIIMDEDENPETVVPILEQYQRDLGVFKANVNYNQINSIRIVGFVMLAVILLCSFGSAIWVFIYRNNQIVKMSQPFFLYLLSFGTTVLGFAILPLSIDDSFFNLTYEDCPGCDSACIAWPWLFCMGFCIIFSTMFSKLWRLNKLIKASLRFRRIQVKPKDVMDPFILLFSLNVILLSIWTVVDPLQWQRIYVDELKLNSYGTCGSFGTGANGDMTDTYFLIGMLAIINISALIIAQVQAFKARLITSDVLNESKYIGLATSCTLQTFLIGLPVIFLVKENPSAKFFVQMSIVFITCMAMLLLIFVPKMYYIKNPPANMEIVTTMTFQGGISKDSNNQEFTTNRNNPSEFHVGVSNSSVRLKELANKEHEFMEYKHKVVTLCKNIKEQHPEMEGIFSSLISDEALKKNPEPKVNFSDCLISTSIKQLSIDATDL